MVKSMGVWVTKSEVNSCFQDLVVGWLQKKYMATILYLSLYPYPLQYDFATIPIIEKSVSSPF
jgi:hypothetical protein